VMMRGTFANIRIRNEMLDGTEGGYTLGPDGKETSIFEAAMAWQDQGTPLVVVAGEQYGAGSSRDWAAKGTALLGVRAVIAESYERIHRSNLVGMGVLPLQFRDGENVESLGLNGHETFSIAGLSDGIANNFANGRTVQVHAQSPEGDEKTFEAIVRIDTPQEINYYQHGGILQYVLRQLLNA